MQITFSVDTRPSRVAALAGAGAACAVPSGWAAVVAARTGMRRTWAAAATRIFSTICVASSFRPLLRPPRGLAAKATARAAELGKTAGSLVGSGAVLPQDPHPDVAEGLQPSLPILLAGHIGHSGVLDQAVELYRGSTVLEQEIEPGGPFAVAHHHLRSRRIAQHLEDDASPGLPRRLRSWIDMFGDPPDTVSTAPAAELLRDAHQILGPT